MNELYIYNDKLTSTPGAWSSCGKECLHDLRVMEHYVKGRGVDRMCAASQWEKNEHKYRTRTGAHWPSHTHLANARHNLNGLVGLGPVVESIHKVV